MCIIIIIIVIIISIIIRLNLITNKKKKKTINYWRPLCSCSHLCLKNLNILHHGCCWDHPVSAGEVTPLYGKDEANSVNLSPTSTNSITPFSLKSVILPLCFLKVSRKFLSLGVIRSPTNSVYGKNRQNRWHWSLSFNNKLNHCVCLFWVQ